MRASWIRRIFRSVPDGSTRSTQYDDGILFIDPAQRVLTLHDRPVNLTRKEWAVLIELIRNPGRLVTQKTFLETAWHQAYEPDSQYIRNIIRQIRLKLDDNPANPRYIETEPGVGYRFLDRRARNH